MAYMMKVDQQDCDMMLSSMGVINELYKRFVQDEDNCNYPVITEQGYYEDFSRDFKIDVEGLCLLTDALADREALNTYLRADSTMQQLTLF